jgi:hypothetical protein
VALVSGLYVVGPTPARPKATALLYSTEDRDEDMMVVGGESDIDILLAPQRQSRAKPFAVLT